MPDAVTLKAFGQTFLERAGKGATANNRACLSRFTAFALSSGGTLGHKPLGAITEDDYRKRAPIPQPVAAAATAMLAVQYGGPAGTAGRTTGT